MSLLTALGELDSKGYRKVTFEIPGKIPVYVEVQQDGDTGYIGNLFQGPGLLCIADRKTLEETARTLEECLLLSCSWVRDILYPVIGKTALERILEEEFWI